MKIAPELLHEWEACWSDAKIDQAAARYPNGATPRQIAEDTRISLTDRLWVVTHALAHADPSTARLYAIECAKSVQHLAGDEHDQAVFAALMSELCRIEEIPEADRDDAREAWYVPWRMARDAAWHVSQAAVVAWNAVWNAAWGEAWGAAWSAVNAAVGAAGTDTAMYAALDQYMTRALELLGKEADQ